MEKYICHSFNKSIAGYKIFWKDSDFQRMQIALKYYQFGKNKTSLSTFLKAHPNNSLETINQMAATRLTHSPLKVICYCLMPTHFHLILEANTESDVSKFTGDVLNSYTRHFNLTQNRKGPLWQSKSKKISCSSNEQLLHLTRYIHLNPTTAYLTDLPEEWPWSSYHEYLDQAVDLPLCDFKNRIALGADQYKLFAESGIEYQRQLAHIKSSLTSPI